MPGENDRSRAPLSKGRDERRRVTDGQSDKGEIRCFLNFSQMTTDTAGAVLVTGTFKGSIAFAPMPLTLTHVGWGEFLVKFAP